MTSSRSGGEGDDAYHEYHTSFGKLSNAGGDHEIRRNAMSPGTGYWAFVP
jgi:hypothetical protein